MDFDLRKKYRWLATASVIAVLGGCSNLVVNPPSHSDNVADFERAWSITDSLYPYFQFKHINWDSIHTVYAPGARDAQGDQIFQVLYDMLGELKDGHAEVYTEGGFPIPTYIPPRMNRDRGTFDPLVVRRYFNEELNLAGDNNMDYGILAGNIGYVRISTFDSGNWIYDFDGILKYMSNTKGLIIDVRDNGGGSSNQGDYVVSRLITSPLSYAPAYFMGKLLTGPPIQPGGHYPYHKPVVVLMNGACFSAAEDFLNEAGQVPTVTLVGDTSAGASGYPYNFTLPSGRRIRVSTHDYRRYDGMPIEWNGIIPDVLVTQTPADLKSGHDLQLERAIELLR